MLNVFLDDSRVPNDCWYVTNPSFYRKTDWKIVRSYKEFVSLIEKEWAKGNWPETITFDHDLGYSHYGIPCTHENYDSTYVGLEEKTGLDCAKWLADFCLEKNLDLPNILVHSMNTVGSDNIYGFFNSFSRFRNSEKL